MGKINKYANIYDKNGELLRHVDENGVLQNYTIKELEDLLDKLVKEKAERATLENVQAILYEMYRKNPKHVEEMLKELQEKAKSAATEKTTEEQINKAMEELKEELEKPENEQVRPSDDPDYSMEKYVDFEEVKEDGEVQV